jgi:ankyrin repeat protein
LSNFLSPAAEHGNAEVLFWLGLYYEKDEKLPNNESEAKEWYRNVAARGLAKVQYIFAQNAIAEKQVDDIVALILNGKDINVKNESGSTLLHEVVSWSGSIKFARGLVGIGADVNAKNRDGCTPLHLAMKQKKMRKCKLLIACGSDIFAKDNDDKTPFDYANKKDCILVIDYFSQSQFDSQ